MSLLLTRTDAHPFMGMDVPWLLEQRALTRRDHPFIVWVPFDAPAQQSSATASSSTRVQRIAGGLHQRGVRRGDRVLIHLDNCAEALLAWYACTWLGAVAVTTNARAAGDELAYYAEHSEAVAGITQPRFAELVAAHCPGLRWLAVTATDNGEAPAARHRTRPAVRRHRRRAAAAPRARPAGAVQRAVHLGHHLAAQGRAVDPCQRAVGRAHQRRARRPAPRGRASGAPAAVPHQRAGLFGAGLPVGRRHRGGDAALFGQPLLGRVAGAPLHLDLAGALLRQGADGSGGAGAPLPAVGQRGQRAADRRALSRQDPRLVGHDRNHHARHRRQPASAEPAADASAGRRRNTASPSSRTTACRCARRATSNPAAAASC